uniref:Uncharacterized protein n=1 Tax=Anguilla anguilla TaxID=7936 RepID=A0A0E9TVK1_ANGAN
MWGEQICNKFSCHTKMGWR